MKKFLLRIAITVVFLPLYVFAVSLGALGLIGLSILLAMQFVLDWRRQ